MRRMVMGLSASLSQNPAARQAHLRNKQIEGDLERDKVEEIRTIKLLLLGTSRVPPRLIS